MTSKIQPRTLALVGMPGAGKSLCAEYLEQKGYYQFRFGGIVTDEVEARGWEINPKNEQIVRLELRANEGMDVMAKRALPQLHKGLETHQTIIIDGLYSFSEYKTLRKEFPDSMIVVAITASRQLRYARLTERPIRPLTVEEAQHRDWQEIETMEKGGPIAIADYTLVNDGTTEDLLSALDTLLADLNMTV
ncbi:MAG: dephospho-CoA kinase [Phototrophicaceae bacterium]